MHFHTVFCRETSGNVFINVPLPHFFVGTPFPPVPTHLQHCLECGLWVREKGVAFWYWYTWFALPQVYTGIPIL